MMSQISAVDLFCGAGGLTHGLKQAGISVRAGIDIDPLCEYPYEANNEAEFVKKDIRNLEGEKVEQYFLKDETKVLVGCAPCQPFSTLKNETSEDDSKWNLLNHFSRIIEDVEPTIISMENVPQLRNYDIFNQFIEDLEKLDYDIWWDIVYCPDYGIPQKRRRLVLLASKLGEISLIEPENRDDYRTVRDEIGDIEPLEAGEQSSEDPLHTSRKLQEINIKRIRKSEPGGTWEDWPDELKLDCHKKESGSSYTSVYGRMKWDEPSPTMTTQCFNYGSGRFGHPEQDRAISLREAALLQTFPKDYEFAETEEDVRFEQMGRLIGNSVPVKLGEVIGKTINKHLNKYKIE